MIQLMQMPDAERFIDVVNQSRGDVFVQLPDSSLCNLKTDHSAQQLIKLLNPQKADLSIILSDPDDVPAFFRYMTDMSA